MNDDPSDLANAYLDDEEHWLVVYGYGQDPQRVFVADPMPRWARSLIH